MEIRLKIFHQKSLLFFSSSSVCAQFLQQQPLPPMLMRIGYNFFLCFSVFLGRKFTSILLRCRNPNKHCKLARQNNFFFGFFSSCVCVYLWHRLLSPTVRSRDGRIFNNNNSTCLRLELSRELEIMKTSKGGGGPWTIQASSARLSSNSHRVVLSKWPQLASLFIHQFVVVLRPRSRNPFFLSFFLSLILF